jgi:hypothetical protein
MPVNPFIEILNQPQQPQSKEAGYKAVATLYHAYLTGMILNCTLQEGAVKTGEWVFRLFRKQHLEKFKSSFDKLGLTDCPDAVAAAQYHYLSNSVGGVEVEYMYENDRKAWVHFCHPRWMYDGTALCGVPVEVSHGFLRGWYGHNGVSLGNPRLGFVCVSQDMTGQYGLAGYFKEYDRDLAPEERLRFSPGENAPPFDADAAPKLEASVWPASRLVKAHRNYTMEYIKTGLYEMCALLGPARTLAIGGHSAALIGRQFYRNLQSILALSDNDDSPQAFATFMQRLATAQDDNVTIETSGDSVLIHWQGWRLMRGLNNQAGEVFEAWCKLWEGCLAVHNRFLLMDVIAREDYGDECTTFRVRGR